MKKKEIENPVQTPPSEEEAHSVPEEPAAQADEQQPQEQEASIDQWREALEAAVKQRDEYLDSLRRSQADFQNFRRRNQTLPARTAIIDWRSPRLIAGFCRDRQPRARHRGRRRGRRAGRGRQDDAQSASGEPEEIRAGGDPRAGRGL